MQTAIYNFRKGYRYGFQGQEKDDEVKGAGNSLNYKFRIHDSRLGRFFVLDPLTRVYPHNSPYSFSENRVIDGIELEGLEVVHFMNTGNKQNITKMTEKEVKVLFKKNNVRFDSDWLDADAANEYWTVRATKDFWGNSTGTLIEKYSSKTSFSKSGSKPYLSEWDRNLFQWLAAKDAQLEGPDGVGVGISLMVATWGTLLSGGSLLIAEGALATAGATVGFVLSADELTTSPEGQTILNMFAAEISEENGAKILNGAKIAFNFKQAGKGIVNITATLVSGKQITGTFDLINNVFDSITTTIDVIENKKKKEEKQDKKTEDTISNE